MKSIKILTFSLLTTLALFACGPQIAEDKLADLGALESKLDTVYQKVESIDSARSMEAVIEFEKNIEIIQYDLKDTFPRETAFFVDEYYRLKKALRNFAKDYNALAQETAISKNQLKNLRKDAENGLVEKEQFNDYLELEKENVNKLYEVSNSIIPPMQKALPIFEAKNPKIDSIIQAYQAKQMNE